MCTQVTLANGRASDTNAAKTKTPRESIPRRPDRKITSCATYLACLRCRCVHAIQFLCQPTKVRVKRDEAGRALKESFAAGVMRHAIQRALAKARRELTAAGQ